MLGGSWSRQRQRPPGVSLGPGCTSGPSSSSMVMLSLRSRRPLFLIFHFSSFRFIFHFFTFVHFSSFSFILVHFLHWSLFFYFSSLFFHGCSKSVFWVSINCFTISHRISCSRKKVSRLALLPLMRLFFFSCFIFLFSPVFLLSFFFFCNFFCLFSLARVTALARLASDPT